MVIFIVSFGQSNNTKLKRRGMITKLIVTNPNRDAYYVHCMLVSTMVTLIIREGLHGCMWGV